MSDKVYLTHQDIQNCCSVIATTIKQHFTGENSKEFPKVYPIPRGGVPATYILQRYLDCVIVATPEEADFFFDDLIDSGATLKDYCARYDKPFYAAVVKEYSGWKGQWLVFPWEGTAESSIQDNIVRLLQYVGEDPTRGGLLETPKRVAKAWEKWTSGYNVDIKALLKVFEDGAENCDEMVTVKDIPIYSHCEHHMAAIIGTVTISYIPDGKIVGLSKLSRLADAFARRLQVQERLTNQIADALFEHLKPKGVGVMLSARHLCMESRGVCQQGHHTITTALRGVIKEDPQARAEFLLTAKG